MFSKTRNIRQRRLQIGLLVAEAVVLVAGIGAAYLTVGGYVIG